ncbi:STAS/SEC14 domain-containing protein [Mariprofundus ferrooxydans]|uniref:STAS/SEC14 domain-containing protein n=1 Tax=Mariprofundus ferrooxydans TaxID=314344 RepID=UPI0003701AF6|nr:STAS/SEC14 domain-containing protein [Mariprofundus ferrooxydans]
MNTEVANAPVRKHMSVEHTIDHDARLIITVWKGAASGQSLSNALRNYQQTIKVSPECQHYNELVDFSLIGGVDLSARDMMSLGRVAQQSDQSDVRTRLALLVASPLVFGLAKMYVAYRSLVPGSHKDLAVFRSRTEALAWLSADQEDS